MIAEVLLAAEPGSRIVGEELSPEVVTEGLVWIVDPLDGTTNFLHDFPSYAVSIAAAVDGVLEAGVVVQRAAPNEMYTAARGGGAWQGERRLSRLRHRAIPAFALIGTGFPFKDISRARRNTTAVRAGSRGTTSGIRRPGSAALDLARRRRRPVRRLLGAAALGLGHRGGRRC